MVLVPPRRDEESDLLEDVRPAFGVRNLVDRNARRLDDIRRGNIAGTPTFRTEGFDDRVRSRSRPARRFGDSTFNFGESRGTFTDAPGSFTDEPGTFRNPGVQFTDRPGTFTDATAFTDTPGTFGDRPDVFGEETGRFTGPPRPPGVTPRQQQAATNLVTAPSRGEVRDTAGDRQSLLQAPIADLSENAVQQESPGFAAVRDPGSGFSVPNLADEQTRESFDRFFESELDVGPEFFGEGQRQRDQDPTRAAFQNTFFPSETLRDVGGRRDPRERRFNRRR